MRGFLFGSSGCLYWFTIAPLIRESTAASPNTKWGGGGKKSIESSASSGSRRRTEKRKIPGGRLAPPITNGIYSTTSPLVRRRSVFSGGGEVCGGSRGEKNIYGLEFNEGGFWPPHWIFTLVEIPPGNYLPLPRRKNLPRALSNCQTCVDSLLEQAKVFFFPEDGLR